VPTLLPDLGSLGVAGDLRTVILDLDLNEPAVLSPLLRAVRKLAGPTSTEVRRIAVGRVEVGVSTRLSAASLLAGVTRELASVATVTRTGAERGDRITAQIRLSAQLPPPPPPAPPAAGAAAAPPVVR
jgi:hypothetical protein